MIATSRTSWSVWPRSCAARGDHRGLGGQEPGTAGEIATFCSATYGVTFPLTEKVDVNGPGRHALYAELTATDDASGDAGDVQWNFEKFLVAPGGKVVARFRPRTDPESDEVVHAVEAALPG